MSITVEQYKNDEYYICLYITREYDMEIYVVEACQNFSDYVGRPFRSMSYSIKDKKKAYATYKRYIKKYCELE